MTPMAYVSRLITDYEHLRRNPRAWKIGVTAVIENLRRELGEMQAATERGVVLARRWELLIGDLP
jgi:hypothetical protein